MLNFLKFILWFISLILLFVLVNVSFFSNIDNDNKINLEFLKSITWTGEYINFLNDLDNIYSYDNSFEVTENGKNIDISLEKGVYIFDLNDLTKQYKILANWFNLQLKASWGIYIDTTWDKILIFSLDSTSVINFLNKKNELVNSYYLYPHEYIKFNPVYTAISFKDVDIYRMRGVSKKINKNKNLYFEDKLLGILDTNNDIKFEEIIWKENILILRSYVENKLNNIKLNNSLYKELINLKNTSFPFSVFINKYFDYFINDSKKAIFIQNNIYNNVVILFKNNTFNKDQITNDLNKLKKLDTYKYDDSISMIDDIYRVIIFKNNILNNYKLENFIFFKNTSISNIENYLLLKKQYFNYNFFNSEKNNYFFNSFIDLYLTNVWIEKQWWSYVLMKNSKLMEVESFIFFLKEYIDSHLFLWDISNLNSDISILWKYINLNKMIYFWTDNDLSKIRINLEQNKDSLNKIRTSLTQNKDLLENLEVFLKNTFFEKNRDTIFDILILKNLDNKDLKDKAEILNNFKKEIDKIIFLFTSNEDLLLENSSVEIDDYNSLISSFDEMFKALNNYDKYKSNSDKLKEFNERTGLWKIETKIYTNRDIYLYLSQFNLLYFDEKNILKKELYFEISNVSIYDIYYDIYLYPNLWNKIEFFEIWTDETYSYDLDSIKEQWDEKYKWAQDEDKDKLDFLNFFKEKFKKQTDSDINKSSREEICALSWQIPDRRTINWCKAAKEDDWIIVVFKRDTLLKEEFNVIKDFFFINYKDLFVNLLQEKYSIYIKNVVTKITLGTNSNKKDYILELSSDYDFDNHEFYNIKFNVKEDKKNWIYLFNWIKIDLWNKKIKIWDLKVFLEKYLININNLYSILRWKFVLNNLEIRYVSWRNYLKFDNNWKNIIIKTEGGKILSIMKDWTNIILKPINISELWSIINKLN